MQNFCVFDFKEVCSLFFVWMASYRQILEFISQLFNYNNKTTPNPRQTQKYSNLNLKKIICLYGKETNEIQSNLSWKNKEWWLWA